MVAKKRSGYVRVKTRTQIAIERLGVQLTQEWRKPRVSADETIWSLIERTYPELAKEAEQEATVLVADSKDDKHEE